MPRFIVLLHSIRRTSIVLVHKLLLSIGVTLLAGILPSLGQTNISGTINDYTEVTSVNSTPCSTLVDVVSPGPFSQGDRVLIIQMKGATINTSNTSNYGSVSNFQNAGNYEFSEVTNVNGNTVVLQGPLLRSYTPSGLVQLIRVPNYTDATVTAPLTAQSWDGTTGGVVVLEVNGNLTLNADVNVTSDGFRGAVSTIGGFSCGESDYAYTTASGNGGRKGEGITASTLPNEAGRGPLANGGGGGNNHNSGGAGGGNGARGGEGGDQWTLCPGPNFDFGGDGGRAMNYSNAQNRVFLGGGGGAGHSNDTTNQAISGTNGGGIVMIRAGSLTGNGNAIRADGVDQNNAASLDGSGGGGAGGSVLLDVGQFNGALTVSAEGGRGGDNAIVNPNGCLGPGGGGGGGVVWSSLPALPATVTTNLSGGQNGVSTNPSNSCAGSYGATSGNNGIILNDLSIPDNPYVPPTASVAFSDTSICRGASIQLSASGASNFQWFPTDSLTNPSVATPIASPDSSRTYSVIVSDGICQDTATVDITVLPLPMPEAGPDTSICDGGDVQLQASGGNAYSWNPSIGLDDPGIPDPSASPPSTLTYTVTVTDTNGCEESDDITVVVNPLPTTDAGPNKEICLNDTTQLMGVDDGNTYTWQPQTALSNPNSPTSFASPVINTTYELTETNQFGCQDSDQVTVTVRPLPSSGLREEATIFLGESVTLTTGGDSALWTPQSGLTDPFAAETEASPRQTTTYLTQIFNEFGCRTIDSVRINIERCAELALPTAFSPNNDGFNDDFGLLNEGLEELETFQIYDRWGNLVFKTDELNDRWEGRHTKFNTPAQAGVYVYVIKGRCNNQEVVKQGNVTLVR